MTFGQNLAAVYLVWPSEDNESEVLVIVATAGYPDVIRTAIKSGDMMKEDAWIQIYVDEDLGSHDLEGKRDEEDKRKIDVEDGSEDGSEDDSEDEHRFTGRSSLG
ncbi:hypothetical protein H0H87_011179 [Tephrocybe sp. NHM501043]|nr:hypothetical protein H0H87_011179 [Tephrocybe sp. NHM501043]